MTQWRVGHQKRWKGAWQHSKAVFQSWQETKPVVRTRVHVRVSSPPSRAFHITWCLFNTAGDFRKAACIALLPRVKAGRGQGDAGRQSSPATPFLYHSKGGYGKTTATATVEACLEAFIHRIGGGGGRPSLRARVTGCSFQRGQRPFQALQAAPRHVATCEGWKRAKQRITSQSSPREAPRLLRPPPKQKARPGQGGGRPRCPEPVAKATRQQAQAASQPPATAQTAPEAYL